MNKKILCLFALLSTCLVGCSAMWGWGDTRTGVSSSLVDYLYPDGEVPPDLQERVPHLELPLRVGIAFVPAQSVSDTISEATKMQLLDKVKASFEDREYISHIEVIPETYLRSSKGISGMQQVARLYGADVMALVSYDQVAASEDKPSGFLYWTIVGAYVVKGTSNEVQTFVDTAVFDVGTSKLLFRAPGSDSLSDRSTLAGSPEALRKGRDESFARAMATMTGNLETELGNFEQRLQEDPRVASTEWKPGHGGGAADWWLLVVLAVSTVAGACRSRCYGSTGEDSNASKRAQRSASSALPAST